MKSKLLFIHTLSPLHAGTGQGVGVIDQPIAREKATNIPFLPGSSIRGVLRDACAGLEGCDEEVIFGSSVFSETSSSGLVQVSDARLLLLPVRSVAGIFAWVTSPFMLMRLKRDLKNILFSELPPTSIPSFDGELSENNNYCFISETDSSLVISMDDNSQVVIEDLPLNAMVSTELQEWAVWLGQALFPQDTKWQRALKNRLCLVPDDVFSFLVEIGTEVTARIKIEDQSKTVAEGALWYEEALPAETILCSLVVASKQPKIVFNTIGEITATPLQFGGSANIGRGFCQTVFIPREE